MKSEEDTNLYLGLVKTTGWTLMVPGGRRYSEYGRERGRIGREATRINFDISICYGTLRKARARREITKSWLGGIQGILKTALPDGISSAVFGKFLVHEMKGCKNFRTE